ncbi:MAG TPA: aminoacyl-tRNA deacylase [Phototrophicaceae bacterium]|nr:aminoacyl-tRNA deacylase [Phototrophicaceae bacterium]
MAPKLNSMRLLEQNKIPYELVEFPDTMRDAEEIAEVLGAPPFLVYKTLVVQPDSGGKPFLVMIASNRHLDLKKLAAVAGEKKIHMAAHKDAEALTGLKVGGIGALALTHKNWTVFIDQPATEHQHIMVSAGQRGMDLRVPTMALITLLHARIADVGTDVEGS